MLNCGAMNPSFATREDDIKVFSYSIISLAKLCLNLKDQFFIKRAYSKLVDLISCFISFATDERPKQELVAAIDGALEFLDYLEYLKLADDTPLFVAKKNLLNLKLSLVPELHPVETKNKTAVIPSPQPPKELGQAKEKIINLIRQNPEIRVKEIISQLTFAPRTVKRYLAELVKDGVLKKLLTDSGVQYTL